jgi:aminopeptidase-like protein
MIRHAFLSTPSSGEEEYGLALRLFPICRSITGDGVRESLQILSEYLPALTVHEVPSGTQAFDWIVPEEWNVRDAYIVGPEGSKVIDFKQNNLHLMSYSIPFNDTITLEELESHLYSLPEKPDVIPYVTSYYERTWGFCLRHRDRVELKPGLYRVVIDSSLKPGHLTYGELLIPGRTTDEVLLSTYICHPSMANNEVSGPVVSTFLARSIASLGSSRYSYRFIFVPETIGSIVYMSRNLRRLRKRVVAGFVVTCVGDNGSYSYLPSRTGDTLADRVARHVLKNSVDAFTTYDFAQRGSDERQYCSPGMDLPVASIMRSKYHEYPEYHTSADNMDFISQQGLTESVEIYRRCVQVLETNCVPRTTTIGEPHLSSRGLYPTIGGQIDNSLVNDIVNVTAFADGSLDLLQIAELVQRPSWSLAPTVALLEQHGLITIRSSNRRKILRWNQR